MCSSNTNNSTTKQIALPAVYFRNHVGSSQLASRPHEADDGRLDIGGSRCASAGMKDDLDILESMEVGADIAPNSEPPIYPRDGQDGLAVASASDSLQVEHVEHDVEKDTESRKRSFVAIEPGAKRMRGLLLGPADTTRQRGGEAAADEFGLVVAQPLEDNECEDKECIGCFRSCRNGLCWFSLLLVAWALPGQRGQWCKDCFNCWRLMFSNQATLIVFTQWLRRDINFCKWELTLLAYLSLKKDGSDRVSENMVHTRVATLTWSFQAMNVPITRGIISKLSEVNSDSPLDPARLVSMASSSGDRCLGYVREEPRFSTGNFVQRPGERHAVFKWRSILYTDHRGDMDILRTNFPNDQFALEGDPERQIVVSAVAVSKHCKIDALIDWAKTHLIAFSSSEWPALKESSFTPAFIKFAAFKAEVASEGADDIVSKCDLWTKALTQAKLFIRRYKTYVKNKKASNLMNLHPAIDVVVTFLNEMSVEMHVSLATLRLKVLFYCSTKKTWADMFREIVGLGLEAVVGSIPSGGDVSAEGWLRSLLLGKIAYDVEHLDVKACEAKRSEFANCCHDISGIIGRFAKQVACGPVAADMASLHDFFSSGLVGSEVSAAKAFELEAELKKPKFTLVKDALDKSPAGQEFSMALRDILRRGAEDSIADSRCELSTEALNDDIVVRVVVNAEGGCLSLRNAHLVIAGDVDMLFSLHESLQYLLEAKRQWSPVRLLEQTETIKGVVLNILQGVEAIDLAMRWLLRDLVIEVLEAASGVSEDMQAKVSFEHSFDGEPADTVELLSSTSAFSNKYAQFMDVLMNSSRQLENVSGLVEKMHTVCFVGRANSKTASLVMNVALGLIKLFECDFFAKPVEAFRVWVESPQDSTFQVALSWVEDVQALVSSDDFVLLGGNVEGSTSIQLQGSDGDLIGAPTTIDSIVGLRSLACGGPLAQRTRMALGEVASLIVTAFAEAIEIEGLKLQAPIVDDFSTKTIQQIVETFVNPARMTKSQNMAMKKFMRNSGDELKGTETEKMMQKVFKLGDIKRVDLKIGLVQAPADQVGADEVLAVVGLMTIVHNVACTLLVVRVEMKSPSNCLANRVVRADIKKCVTSGIQQCDEGLVSIETQASILIAAESVTAAWRMGIQGIKNWLKGSRVALQQVASTIFSQCVRDLEGLSQTVAKLCPKYNHFCNDVAFSSALARKHLLGHVFKDQLLKEAGVLWRSISQLVPLAAELSLDHPSKNKVSSEVVEQANMTYQAAKHAIMCTAACNIIINFDGDTRIAKASDFCEKKGSLLPKALHAALKEHRSASAMKAPSGLAMKEEYEQVPT